MENGQRPIPQQYALVQQSSSTDELPLEGPGTASSSSRRPSLANPPNRFPQDQQPPQQRRHSTHAQPPPQPPTTSRALIPSASGSLSLSSKIDDVLSHAVSTLQTQIIAINTQQPSVRNTLPPDVKKHIESLTAENNALIGDKTKIETKLHDVDKKHTELQQRYDNLAQGWHALNNDHARLTNELAAFRGANTAYKNVNEEQSIRMRDAEGKVLFLQERNAELQKKYTDLSNQWIAYNGKIEGLHQEALKERDAYKAAVVQMRDPNGQFQQSLRAQAEAQFSERERALHERVHAAEAQYAALYNQLLRYQPQPPSQQQQQTAGNPGPAPGPAHSFSYPPTPTSPHDPQTLASPPGVTAPPRLDRPQSVGVTSPVVPPRPSATGPYGWVPHTREGDLATNSPQGESARGHPGWPSQRQPQGNSNPALHHQQRQQLWQHLTKQGVPSGSRQSLPAQLDHTQLTSNPGPIGAAVHSAPVLSTITEQTATHASPRIPLTPSSHELGSMLLRSTSSLTASLPSVATNESITQLPPQLHMSPQAPSDASIMDSVHASASMEATASPFIPLPLNGETSLAESSNALKRPRQTASPGQTGFARLEPLVVDDEPASKRQRPNDDGVVDASELAPTTPVGVATFSTSLEILDPIDTSSPYQLRPVTLSSLSAWNAVTQAPGTVVVVESTGPRQAGLISLPPVDVLMDEDVKPFVGLNNSRAPSVTAGVEEDQLNEDEDLPEDPVDVNISTDVDPFQGNGVDNQPDEPMSDARPFPPAVADGHVELTGSLVGSDQETVLDAEEHVDGAVLGQGAERLEASNSEGVVGEVPEEPSMGVVVEAAEMGTEEEVTETRPARRSSEADVLHMLDQGASQSSSSLPTSPAVGIPMTITQYEGPKDGEIVPEQEQEDTVADVEGQPMVEEGGAVEDLADEEEDDVDPEDEKAMRLLAQVFVQYEEDGEQVTCKLCILRRAKAKELQDDTSDISLLPPVPKFSASSDIDSLLEHVAQEHPTVYRYAMEGGESAGSRQPSEPQVVPAA